MYRLVARFRGDRRASVAIEFAFVAMIFLMSLVMVLMVGLITYQQMCLDFAVSKAARQVMIGAVAKSGMTQSAMISSLICPYLPYGMTCSNVILNVYNVPEAAQPAGYYAFVNLSATALTMPALSNTAASYALGAQNQFEYMQVIYPITLLPSGLAKYLSGGQTYNGKPAYLLVSTAAFKNEQY